MKNFQGKINIKYMLVMGFVGVFLGMFLSALVMIVMADNQQLSYGKVPFLTITGIVVLIFGFWGSRMREEAKEKEEFLNQEGLTKREKIIAWIFILINPVIAGAVMYYIWIKSYPVKAKQVNNISLTVFFVWVLILFVFVVFGGLHDTGKI